MKNILRQGSLTVVCQQCKQTFKENPSRVRRGRGKFCSWVCLSEWKKMAYAGRKGQKQYGQDNPNWRGIRVPRPCQFCGVIFIGPTKTCSIPCGRKLRSQTISGPNNPYSRMHPASVKICKGCGKEYTRQQRASETFGAGKSYCSSACSVRNQYRSLRQVHIADRITVLIGEQPILEQSWPWLRSPLSNQRLRVDIYLPTSILAIEYHGKQHFDPKAFGQSRDTFEKVQARDKAKAELLAQHGISLIILSDWPIPDAALLSHLGL